MECWIYRIRYRNGHNSPNIFFVVLGSFWCRLNNFVAGRQVLKSRASNLRHRCSMLTLLGHVGTDCIFNISWFSKRFQIWPNMQFGLSCRFSLAFSDFLHDFAGNRTYIKRLGMCHHDHDFHLMVVDKHQWWYLHYGENRKDNNADDDAVVNLTIIVKSHFETIIKTISKTLWLQMEFKHQLPKLY